jgi:SAM-dependent methyltransferase
MGTVEERLREITRGEGTRGLVYPDTDNQMEDGVFTFAKRTDERRVWAALVDRVPRGGRALDVGCGLGAHAHELDARFPGALLVDADAARAQSAAQRTGFAFLERVFVARIDDDSLRHADLAGAFAFVQLVQVLGHVPLRHVAPALETVRHLLAPGGHALLAVPFAGTPRDLFFVTALDHADARVRPRDVAPHEYDALARAPEAGKLPVRHFTMTSVLSALSVAGLTVVDAQPYHWFSHDTGDLMVLARKPA